MPARLTAVASSLFVAAVLAGCGSSAGAGAEAAGNTLEKAQKAGKITVGIAGEAPYSFMEGGEPTGATIALAEEIFGNLGIAEVDAVLVDWNSLIPGLNAKRFDMVSAGMAILPERCAQAAFSDPESTYNTALMVRDGNPKNLATLQDVANAPDVKLAVLSGGVEATYAQALGAKNIQSVPDAQTGMDLVANGRVDAFAMTSISLNYMSDQNPDVPVDVTPAFTNVTDGKEDVTAGAAVFRKEDNSLREAYNAELAKITASEETYVQIVGDFGFTGENLPSKEIRTEDLCTGKTG
jgi:polar amino acid transport system substrate-binding protein